MDLGDMADGVVRPYRGHSRIKTAPPLGPQWGLAQAYRRVLGGGCLSFPLSLSHTLLRGRGPLSREKATT